jgi:hypothetical protein
MRDEPFGGSPGKLAGLAVICAALVLLTLPGLAGSAPQGQEPTPTVIAGGSVTSPFRSNIVPPSGADTGAAAGFRPQGAQGPAQPNWTMWTLICCLVLVVLAAIWAALFWMLGRRRAKPKAPGKEPVRPRPAEPRVPAAPIPALAPVPPVAPPTAEPAPAASAERAPTGASLTMEKGPQPGWRYAIAKSPVAMGSSPESDMTISGPEVSPHHAMIWKEGDYHYIQDVGSGSGTFVNGERLTKPRLLSDGDEIRFGSGVTLAFHTA